MTLAYLQVGQPEHGICRYGRLLAAEGRTRSDVAILERSIVLTGTGSRDRRDLRTLAGDLSEADLVHLQVSMWPDDTWGEKWQSLLNLREFRRHCRVPLAFTLHDVNRLASLNCGRAGSCLARIALEIVKGPLRPPVRLLRQLSKRQLRPAAAFHRAWDLEPICPCVLAHWIARAGQALFTLSGSEEKVLHAMGIGLKTILIPHFVENPPPIRVPPHREGLPTKTVIVAGFLVGSKGHELLLDAMPLLPGIQVVFVGGPSPGALGHDKGSDLMELAKRKGTHDRLRVTGYLAEHEYQRYLHAADLAVCPFPETKSASGSLSSLIAAECPTLASDIPLIAEYNAIVPGAIRVFRPYTPEALATAIRTLLEMPREALTCGLAELRQRLSIASIYDRHAEVYRRVLARPSSPPSSSSSAATRMSSESELD